MSTEPTSTDWLRDLHRQASNGKDAQRRAALARRLVGAPEPDDQDEDDGPTAA